MAPYGTVSQEAWALLSRLPVVSSRGNLATEVSLQLGVGCFGLRTFSGLRARQNIECARGQHWGHLGVRSLRQWLTWQHVGQRYSSMVEPPGTQDLGLQLLHLAVWSLELGVSFELSGNELSRGFDWSRLGCIPDILLGNFHPQTCHPASPWGAKAAVLLTFIPRFLTGSNRDVFQKRSLSAIRCFWFETWMKQRSFCRERSTSKRPPHTNGMLWVFLMFQPHFGFCQEQMNPPAWKKQTWWVQQLRYFLFTLRCCENCLCAEVYMVVYV